MGPGRYLSDLNGSFAPAACPPRDIVVYPDSNKISAAERNADGEGLKVCFDRGDEVGYWQGEEPPGGGAG